MSGPEATKQDEPRLLAEFLEAVAQHSARLASELGAAWKDASAVLESVRHSYDFIDFVEFPPEPLPALEALFREHAQHFLVAPLQALQQRRPLARTLDAVQEFETSAVDEMQRLPRLMQISGADLAQALGERAGSPALVRWRSLHRKPRPVMLRECVAGHVQRLIVARSELDGAATLLLAQVSLHVAALWKAFRRGVLSSLAAGGLTEPELATQRQWWMQVSRRYYDRAAQVLARYAEWADGFPKSIARAVLLHPNPLNARSRSRRADRAQKRLTFWARQHRAVQADLNLELHLAEFGAAATRETMAAVAAVDSERSELVAELHAAVEWLRQWPAVDSPHAFPPPGARLSAAQERTASVIRRIGALSREMLPSTVEAVQPRRRLPGATPPWRELAPVKAVLLAFDQLAAPVLIEGFREAENAHRAVVRQIERAREVVSFGFETVATTGNREFGDEAIVNARSLLAYQQGALPDTHSVIENNAVRGEATALLEAHIALEKSRVGFLAYMTSQRGRAAVKVLGEVSADATRALAREAWSGTRRGSRWVLLKIGWAPAPPKQLESVVRRAHLGGTLEVDLRARDLPMIYRRLFRLAPVEDARFLVGREAELAGLAEAVRRWESAKGAAVMVVGARGSGKTSLLNCASASVLAGYEVIGASFCDRLTTCDQMDRALRQVLGLPSDGDVTAALASSPRIIILEEFERTFLRVMNGFDAVRHLLDIMYATARSTLWIFSTNEAAYRYLDAAVGLGEHFSHRINAMSVRRGDLTNAILQRHNLSGLRLAFAPPPPEDPRVSKLRRILGFEQDPQRLFLDSLYAESEGIFRSAFELWQRCIERVEGGVVHMRQPLAPDYSGLYDELRLDDYFALKAILQHGSLTDDEMARVLGVDPATSRRQFERLRSLEILEAEAACPGMRVRPEAGRFVRDALGRRNLI